MTTQPDARLVGFLRAAALMAGLLAIIAGILGMHIMVDGHATAHEVLTHQQPSHALSHTDHSGALDAAAGERSTPGSSCPDCGSCPDTASMHSACKPSPGSSYLSAPVPGTLSFGTAIFADPGLRAPAFSYLPGSPSPGELCISRT